MRSQQQPVRIQPAADCNEAARGAAACSRDETSQPAARNEVAANMRQHRRSTSGRNDCTARVRTCMYRAGTLNKCMLKGGEMGGREREARRGARLERGRRDARRNRVAAVRRAVLASPDRQHHLVVGKDGRDGVEAAREGLAEDKEVGPDALVVASEHLARAREPCKRPGSWSAAAAGAGALSAPLRTKEKMRARICTCTRSTCPACSKKARYARAAGPASARLSARSLCVRRVQAQRVSAAYIELSGQEKGETEAGRMASAQSLFRERDVHAA